MFLYIAIIVQCLLNQIKISKIKGRDRDTISYPAYLIMVEIGTLPLFQKHSPDDATYLGNGIPMICRACFVLVNQQVSYNHKIIYAAGRVPIS